MWDFLISYSDFVLSFSEEFGRILLALSISVFPLGLLCFCVYMSFWSLADILKDAIRDRHRKGDEQDA